MRGVRQHGQVLRGAQPISADRHFSSAGMPPVLAAAPATASIREGSRPDVDEFMGNAFARPQVWSS